MMHEKSIDNMAHEATPSFELDAIVLVRFEQRIPPEAGGEWKDTGEGYVGRLTNGPNSALNDPERGEFWYVSPIVRPESDGIYGNTHPRQIRVDPEWYGSDPERTVRPVVEVAGAAAVAWAVSMESAVHDG